jgi:hypothetical protein
MVAMARLDALRCKRSWLWFAPLMFARFYPCSFSSGILVLARLRYHFCSSLSEEELTQPCNAIQYVYQNEVYFVNNYVD